MPTARSSSPRLRSLTLGAGGVLTDPEADNRRWCRGFLYADGTLEFTSAAEPDAGRAVLEGGHVCINALYNAVDVIPGAERRDEVLRVVFKEDISFAPS